MSTKKNGPDRPAAKPSKNPVEKTTVREVLDSVMKSPATQSPPTRAEVTSLFTKWISSNPNETEIMDFYNEVKTDTISIIKSLGENLSKYKQNTSIRLEEMEKFIAGNFKI